MKSIENTRAILSAFIAAGITSPRQFPKNRNIKRVPRQRFAPLVIETNERYQDGKRRPARKAIQEVHHVTFVNGERVAITKGGDAWAFEDRGNNYLKAV